MLPASSGAQQENLHSLISYDRIIRTFEDFANNSTFVLYYTQVDFCLQN
jgi:hypothetical protein